MAWDAHQFLMPPLRGCLSCMDPGVVCTAQHGEPPGPRANPRVRPPILELSLCRSGWRGEGSLDLDEILSPPAVACGDRGHTLIPIKTPECFPRWTPCTSFGHNEICSSGVQGDTWAVVLWLGLKGSQVPTVSVMLSGDVMGLY